MSDDAFIDYLADQFAGARDTASRRWQMGVVTQVTPLLVKLDTDDAGYPAAKPSKPTITYALNDRVLVFVNGSERAATFVF